MEENGSAVRIYLPHSVPMPLCGEEAGIAYKYKVVGLGGPGLTRGADWGGWGGTEEGTESYRDERESEVEGYNVATH